MKQSRIFIGIFLFSFSSLAFEIVLTRIFSISLWYHFAFMVISIAMLGMGASGTVLSLFPKLRNSSRIGLYGLLLGISITVSYLLSNRIPFDPVRLSWDRVQILYICIYYLLLSAPFFFFGLSVSTSLSVISEKSGLLYGSDLIGAGMGSVCILLFMDISGPEHAVILVSCIAFAGAFFLAGKRMRFIAALLILLNLFLLTMPNMLSPRMSPYKGLQLALQYPGAEHIRTYHSPFSRIDLFRSPAARFAPGLSLKYLAPLPEQIGLSIDGGDINAVTRADDGEPLGFLNYLPSALPYEIGSRDDVLILEPKGGIEALLAEHYGAKQIVKVESNPLLIKVIRDDLHQFSEGIYDRDTWAGIGRSWLKKGNRTFDVIDIPLVGTSPSGSFGITEDYRFTVEAFKEYLSHIKDHGMVSIQTFIVPPPRTELRILSTLVTSMEETGIKEPHKNIVAIRSWGTVSIIAKKVPFSLEEGEAVRRFSAERRFDLVYLPWIAEGETNLYVRMSSDEYPRAFKAILDLRTREAFLRDYLFDIKPVRDENPFFNYYLKLENIKRTYDVMGKKWAYFLEEGYLLPVVFIQISLLSSILIALPALGKTTAAGKREGNPRARGIRRLKQLPYFASLGLGFMFVEIPLIQKMILPLENSSYAMVTVLVSMLMGSGIGSLMSYRAPRLRSPFVLPLISLLIVGYGILAPFISDAMSPYSMTWKMASVFIILIPLSLPMGVPFPLGIKNLGDTDPEAIPWAWAMNGCLSVQAPVLTIMLAMVIGFKGVLWVGAGAYLLAFIAFPASSSEPHRSSEQRLPM
jgi:hypothetical protein